MDLEAGPPARIVRRELRATLCAAMLVAAPATTAPAADLGVRGGYYADAGKPFLGAELVFPLGERLQMAPSVEVLDADEGHFVNASLDALYRLDCTCNPRSLVWAGAGAAVISEGDGVDTAVRPGLNLLLGFGFRAGPVVPYTHVRATLKERPDVAFAVGLRF